MTGTFSNYTPGHINVKFEPGEYDYVDLHICIEGDERLETYVDDHYKTTGKKLFRMPEQNISYYISPLSCPVRFYLHWLEAVTIGVQECAWEWDAEGPDGRMTWRWRDETTGILEIYWPRYQMVEMFYKAYRDYVESLAYTALKDLNVSRWNRISDLRSAIVESWLAKQALSPTHDNQ
jgi:hypothetical protein